MAKILLVEDNEMNRDMLSRRLARRGFEVVLACDGEEGLAAARTARPDLILLDLMMPVMDGFEFLEAVRADAAWRATPVVVVTAKDLSHEDRERLNGYVQKILQKGTHGRDQLLAEVRELVSASVARRRPRA